MKIVIPGGLPGMNEIIDAAKLHYCKYSSMKKEYTEMVAWVAKAKIKKQLNKIDIEITWICKNRLCDKDNIQAGIKFILDGLVLAGVIKNDGWAHVGNINHKYKIDKHNPRVEVKIQEVN